VGKPEGNIHSEDRGVDGRMGSEWILGRLAGRGWSVFRWLRIGTGGGLLWTRWWTFGLWNHGVNVINRNCEGTGAPMGMHDSSFKGRLPDAWKIKIWQNYESCEITLFRVTILERQHVKICFAAVYRSVCKWTSELNSLLFQSTVPILWMIIFRCENVRLDFGKTVKNVFTDVDIVIYLA
jgi:hypothetical protein